VAGPGAGNLATFAGIDRDLHGIRGLDRPVGHKLRLAQGPGRAFPVLGLKPEPHDGDAIVTGDRCARQSIVGNELGPERLRKLQHRKIDAGLGARGRARHESRMHGDRPDADGLHPERTIGCNDPVRCLVHHAMGGCQHHILRDENAGA